MSNQKKWAPGDGNPEAQMLRAMHGLSLALQEEEGTKRLELLEFAVDMIVTAAVEKKMRLELKKKED